MKKSTTNDKTCLEVPTSLRQAVRPGRCQSLSGPSFAAFAACTPGHTQSSRVPLKYAFRPYAVPTTVPVSSAWLRKLVAVRQMSSASWKGKRSASRDPQQFNKAVSHTEHHAHLRSPPLIKRVHQKPQILNTPWPAAHARSPPPPLRPCLLLQCYNATSRNPQPTIAHRLVCPRAIRCTS